VTATAKSGECSAADGSGAVCGPTRGLLHEDPAVVLEAFWEEARESGVQRCSLFVVPPFHSASTEGAKQFWWGYHPDWIAHYFRARPSHRDEVPDYVIDHGKAMLWSDAVKMVPETDENRQLKAAFFAYHRNDAVSSPLYGPNGNNALLTFSFGIELETADDPRVKAIVATANRAFASYVLRVQSENAAATPLSPRELEIVALSAKGQSNKELARALGISPSSVDTYMRRIFAKLGVTDRVQAVLRCLSLGLVRL
jgi:DNA-binding CsgD family transcriptional regulator